MSEIIFAQKKTYKDGIISLKHWISLNDGDPKEVSEDTYNKLDDNEFEKVKNVNIKKDKPKQTKKIPKPTDNSLINAGRIRPELEEIVPEIIEIISNETKERAYELIHEFLTNFFLDSEEIGYCLCLKDMQDLTNIVREDRFKKNDEDIDIKQTFYCNM